MTIAVADSWEVRSTTATGAVTIPADTVEIGDVLVVVTLAAGGGTPGTPTDDASNTYTERKQSTPDATFTTSIAVADCRVTAIPTAVNVSNSAGGANDVAAVVLRVTHNGSAYTASGIAATYAAVANQTIDDPTSGQVSIPDATTVAVLAGDGAILLVAGLTHDGATTTFAPAGGWTEAEEEEDSASGIPYSVVSKVTTAGGIATHQWTTGASRDYASVLIGYTENVPDLILDYVDAAPSPSVSGVTVGTTSAADIGFPDADTTTFHALTWDVDAGEIPSLDNAELVRAIGIAGDVFDIERGQAGSTKQPIANGWAFAWDHLHSAPLDLLAYVASLELDSGMVSVASAAADAAAAQAAVDAISQAFTGERIWPRNDFATNIATGTTDTAFVHYCVVPRTITITTIDQINIGATTGNIDVGIYSGDATATLTRVWSLGTTASPGNGLQSFNISSGSPSTLTLDPGLYWVAIGASASTITFRGSNAAVAGTGYRKTSSFPLPSSLTSLTENTTQLTPWLRLNQ